MRKTLAEVESEIRRQQGDCDPEDDECRCAEYSDGFYTCPSCQAWQKQKQAELRAQWAQRKDEPEEPCPL